MDMTPRMKPVRDASAWTDDDLGLDQSWKFSLPPVQKDNLHQALQQIAELLAQVAAAQHQLND